jgi:hypothetical protein
MRTFVLVLSTALAVLALTFVGTASAEPSGDNPNAAAVSLGKGDAICWLSLGSSVYESKNYTFVQTKSGQKSFHCNGKLSAGAPTEGLFEDIPWHIQGILMSCTFEFSGDHASLKCKEAPTV